MRRGTRFRRVVLPQIVRASLPALVNEMTLLVKASPAVAVLGIVEITRAAIRVGARTYDPLPPFIVALVLYSLIVFVFVKTQRVIEREQRLRERRHERVCRGLAALGHDRARASKTPLIITIVSAVGALIIGRDADDSLDVATALRSTLRRPPMSTPCAACRSCCSST